MFKKILLTLVVLLAIFAIYVAFQPAQFRVERSASIGAPAPEVFPHINDLKKASAWNRWLKLDPAAKVTYEGPPAGTGASSTAWRGASSSNPTPSPPASGTARSSTCR